MDRTQFTFYESFFKAIQRIRKKADRADAYDVICSYALYGTAPVDSLPDSVAMVFELIKPNLDASRRKAENGKKRKSKPKQNESKPETNESKPEARADEKQEETENKKEYKNELEIKKKYELEYEYTPPVSPSPGEPLPFGPELLPAFQEWLSYKKERRETYKPTGLKALVTEVRHNAETYGERAVAELIRRCMASGWKGIAFDRLKGQPQAASAGPVDWAKVAQQIDREEGTTQ